MNKKPKHATNKPFDVIIAGGGFTGSLLALLLHKQGFNICLVDKRPVGTPPPGLRAFSINNHSLDVFDNVNLKDKLDKLGHSVNKIEVAEAHLLRGISKNIITYDAYKLLGKPFGRIIESPDLFNTMEQALNKLNPDTYLRKSTTIKDLETGDFDRPASITLSNGEKISAWVVCACDGRNSLLRKLAGINVSSKDYNINAIVCNLKLEKDHCGIAVEYFFPSGPFAIVPLPNKKCNVIWCEKAKIAKTLLNLSDKEFMKHMKWRFNNRFGPLQNKFLTRASFPLVMHNAYNYFKNRLVLIGDSAHSIHPIAGLGLNLGFRDVFNFSENMKETRQLGLLPGTRLSEYQNQRRFDVQKFIAITDGIDSIFSIDLPCLRLARQFTFHTINKFEFLKKPIVNNASN